MSDRLTRDAEATLAAFALFQSVFAANAAHGAALPLEVRLQIAETAVDIARVGENLNVLAAVLELPQRVDTIAPEVADAIDNAGSALRSERA